MKKAIILAGGVCPSKRVFDYFRKTFGYTILICADGGLRHVTRLKAVPDYIVGDFDSAPPELLKKFTDAAKIVHLRRQSDTDTEKAIKFALSKKITHLILMGAEGRRMDHEIANLGYLLRYGRKVSIALVSLSSVLHPVNDEITFSSVPGEIISFFSFSEGSAFETSGLKYAVHGAAQPFGSWESLSNVSTAQQVIIKNKGGNAIVVRPLSHLFGKKYFYER